MKAVQIARAVEEARSRLPLTVVLYGPEEYLKRSGVRSLQNAVQVEVPELNLFHFNDPLDMSLLANALSKPAFLSPSKAVIVHSDELLSSRASAAMSDSFLAMRPSPDTLLVIEAGEKLDGRRASVKRLEKEALFVDCEPLKGASAARFVAAEAKTRGLHIGTQAAEQLFVRCEGDMYSVASELEKLCCVCTGEISLTDVEKYGPRSPEASVFEIQDLFLAGKYRHAERAVRALLANDPSPNGFLSIVSNSFRSMLVARTCRDAKFSYAKTISLVCESTGMREWQAKRSYDRCSHFSAERLRRNVERLARIDFGSKQGQFTLESDLYALLFELYGPAGT